jgi:hypothetical protein
MNVFAKTIGKPGSSTKGTWRYSLEGGVRESKPANARLRDFAILQVQLLTRWQSTDIFM